MYSNQYFFSTTECPASTDDHYGIIEYQCYYFHTEAVSFDTAKAICQSKNRPGRIHEPKSLTNLQLLRQAYKEKRNGSGPNCFWIGIDDLTTEGTYLYNSDGSPVDPEVVSSIKVTNNCYGPQNTGGKNCDLLYTCEQITELNTVDSSLFGVVCDV